MGANQLINRIMVMFLTITSLSGCNFLSGVLSSQTKESGKVNTDLSAQSPSVSSDFLKCELKSSSDVVVNNDFLSFTNIFATISGKPNSILFNGVSQQIPSGSVLQLSVAPQTDTQYDMVISNGKKTTSCSQTILVAPCNVMSSFDGLSYSVVADGSKDFSEAEMAFSINDGAVIISFGDIALADIGGRVETAVSVNDDVIKIDNFELPIGDTITQVNALFSVVDGDGQSQTCSKYLLP
ncbi:MAG: hypothetical protein ACKOA8_02875 [Deltaproteobacteria bacterium]